MVESDVWQLTRGDGPLVAAAIHNGHTVRQDVAQLLALSEEQRLREEDPYTGEWTAIAPTRIIGRRSRFEVDLNRPREKAVYRTPEEAWGLHVWQHHPSVELIQDSLAEYDRFYDMVWELLEEKTRQYGRCVVLDLHSYNQRRADRGTEFIPLNENGMNSILPSDLELNPEVNVGTGTMNRARWESLVDRFIHDLRNCDYRGRQLDVRENVKFFGGHFPGWIHEHFSESVCVLAIEVKKFFMDEWTGEVFPEEMQAVRRCLESTIPGICEELEQL